MQETFGILVQSANIAEIDGFVYYPNILKLGCEGLYASYTSYLPLSHGFNAINPGAGHRSSLIAL